MNRSITAILKNNRHFIVFIFLMVIFRTSIADWNSVPTGSMKPTIIEGDRIWVNKLAYDINLPFSHISLKHLADPKYGDIVIFDSARADKRLVKRVIGLPGDTVAMSNNTLIINGKALDYKIMDQEKNKLVIQEMNKKSVHRIQLVYPLVNQYSSFQSLTIPDQYYLVLGDNRNNSADSRFIGLVPRKEIIGRAQHVVMSLNYDNYYLPRLNRFLQTL